MLLLMIVVLQIFSISSYTPVENDYDLYGMKIAINNRLMISTDNLNRVWYAVPVVPNSTVTFFVFHNQTTCDFVYSVIVPLSDLIEFVYNCINPQGQNVIGHFRGNDTYSFALENEQVISNYSAQDNFVINIDGSDRGVYGFADDFIFYYELSPTYPLTIWSNSLTLSPRAFDIAANLDYGIVVGYCQIAVSQAVECGFLLRLHQSLSPPSLFDELSIAPFIQFPYSDPRTNHHISHSRVYFSRTVLSVSVTWATRRVLIGIRSLNLVLLYSIDDPHNLLGRHDDGSDYTGFGKSVHWLNNQGDEAVILTDRYSSSTSQWIVSLIYIYDIQSDGFSDQTQPILIYPNSEQVLFPWINPSLIRLTCSSAGHLAMFDVLGNPVIFYPTAPGTYPRTDSSFYTSIQVPCIPGTHKNHTGIELCFLCPARTYSSDCLPCLSNESFCPTGSIEEISYSLIESIEQDQDYPESPETTVFDELLMENMFSFRTHPTRCLLVSPITWVIVVIVLGLIFVIGMTLHELLGPGTHTIRDRTKLILQKVDLIGEGELWMGGLVSAAVLVLILCAYVFSSRFFPRYPIEEMLGGSSYACDATLRNSRFSTSVQKRPNVRSETKDIQSMFDMLNNQSFSLNFELIQTALSCEDSFFVQRIFGATVKNLTVATCRRSEAMLSLSVLLPVHEVTVQLVLIGVKTIGAIRLGLTGNGAITSDERYSLIEVNFSSLFLPNSLTQVLTASNEFSLELTQIINRTAPLNTEALSTYSAIWSSSFRANTDGLFSAETRYTLFQRTCTNLTITIDESIFYVNNVQEPIARQTEIIFHCLEFTFVVLELFGLMFLIIKLLLVPVFKILCEQIRRVWRKNRVQPFDGSAKELPVIERSTSICA